MGACVAVAGASGYAGGELLRLLGSHPDLDVAVVTGGANNAGRLTGDVHPHLSGTASLAGQVLTETSADSLADCDLAFLALPAGQSAALAPGIPRHVKIVDLGPDFRLADSGAWARHYDGTHAGRWPSGLPELPGARAAITAADRVAVPGCYATAAIMALAPLVTAGLAAPEDVVISAASGTSGAGRALKPELLASEVIGAVSAYQAGGAHRHTPEIEQALDEATGRPPAAAARQPGRARVSFTPMLAPMTRGILATCSARLTAGSADTGQLRAALLAAYSDEPFVAVLPPGRWPSTAAVAGSNSVHLQAAADTRAGRAVVVAALDNLGKGAAGQAVQDANLMLGLPETAGLQASGIAP